MVDTLPEAGYPIAEISDNGELIITKPEATGGTVSIGTVAEQMLYEIGDPQAYLLPDVVCDFSQVELKQQADNRVEIHGALGLGAPTGYKTSATYADGYRSGQVWTMYGRDADIKAEKLAESVFTRARMMLKHLGLGDFSETSYEIIGAESHYGSSRQVGRVREVDVKIAAKHESARGIGVLLKEMIGMALTAPPGLTGFAGARPKPSPVVRLFSMIVPKQQIEIEVEVEGEVTVCSDVLGEIFDPDAYDRPAIPRGEESVDLVAVPLEALAWGRSGDKGNKANIGIIARQAEFVPYIAEHITEETITELFCHFLAAGQDKPVQRFYMPGSNAFNFLLHEVLGGGGIASLRSDPQGKGYAQVLLAEAVQVPRDLAARFELETL